MSIWNKVKTLDLPDEQKADVLKTFIKEEEETKRVKITNANYQEFKSWSIAIICCCIAIVAVVFYCVISRLHEVEPKYNPPAVTTASSTAVITY